MNLATTIEIHAGGPGSGCAGPNCGRPVSGRQEQVATKIERELAKQDRGKNFKERAVLIDSKGKILSDMTERPEVAFTPWGRIPKGGRSEMVLLHSHPKPGVGESKYSQLGFSQNDMYTFIGKDLGELRAVTPDGVVSVVRPPNGYQQSSSELMNMIPERNTEKHVKDFCKKTGAVFTKRLF
jgi:hypothetical protein